MHLLVYIYAFVFIYVSIAIMTIGCLPYPYFYRLMVLRNSLKKKYVFTKLRKFEDLPLVEGYLTTS